MNSAKPHYDLETIRQILDGTGPDDHLFTKTKALDPVVVETGSTQEGAKIFILDQLRRLEIQNFSRTVLIEDLIYDEYGKYINGLPWYIKIALIQEDQDRYIFTISFHPPKQDLNTLGGVIKKYEDSA